jgi:hypothetical protein
MSKSIEARQSSTGGSSRELPSKTDAKGYESEQRGDAVPQRFRLAAGGSLGSGPSGGSTAGKTGLARTSGDRGQNVMDGGKTGGTKGGLKGGTTGGSSW